MRAYLAFTGKEFCEMSRTYKLLIMVAVFLLLGMMNPLTAKFTPQLLAALMPEGMEIVLPEPSALDSWVQFFKNVSQMGMIVMVIIFSGIMANEFAKGTLINMLTKGLPRRTVIFSKLTMAAALWTAVYWMCFLVTWAYTLYFWKDEFPNLLFSVFCMWVFGLLLLTVILLGGVLWKHSYGCLLFVGVFVMTLFMLNIPPQFQEYNPILLASGNNALLTGAVAAGDFVKALVVSVVVMIAAVAAAILVFNKKQV